MARVLCVGHVVHDYVFSLQELPVRAEKYRADRLVSVGGGPAATAAVAVSRLGGQAVLAARVGDDAIAGIVAEELQREAVDCRYVRRHQDVRTSLSAVLLDAHGERMIVNFSDSRMPADPAWLPDPLAIQAQAVLVDTRWPEGALHALQRARQCGLPGILDADQPVPSDGELLRAASHVAFSAAGLAQYCSESDASTAIAEVSRKLGVWCCVTVGEQGAIIGKGGAVTRLPAFRVPVLDTLGAGDVWHGAFALALAEGVTEDVACRFASAAAALKVQRAGGRNGAPTRNEVDAFLEKS